MVNDFYCKHCDKTFEMNVKLEDEASLCCHLCKNNLEKLFPKKLGAFKIKGYSHKNCYTSLGRNPDGSTNKVD